MSLNAPCWTRLRPTGEAIPAPRVSHSSTRVDDKLFVIGGGFMEQSLPHLDEENEPAVFQHHGDVWTLALKSMAWTQVVFPAGAVQMKPSRRGHSAALHAASGRIICFGGSTHGDETLNDTWVLHTAPQCVWVQPECSGAVPRPRRGHRASIHCEGTTYLVVGGYAKESSDDSIEEIISQQAAVGIAAGEPQASDGGLVGMHVLRLAQWLWESVRVSGAVPHGLALFGLVAPADGRDSILCFAGHEYMRFRGPRRNQRCCNTLWSCDVSDLRNPQPVAAWEIIDLVIEPSSTADRVDEAAARAGQANIAAALAPPGGRGGSGAHEGPPARFCLELVEAPTAAGGGDVTSQQRALQRRTLRLLVFGGTDGKDTTLNDLHLLTIESTALSGSTPGSESCSSPPTRMVYTATQIDVPSSSPPTPRNGMSLACVDDASSLFILFGGGVFRTAYYNDTFLFELETSAPVLPPLPPLSASVLLPHLASLVAHERFSDVDIQPADGGPVLPAHKILLCSGASRYFDLALGEDGAGGFREASAAKAGTRVTLGLPGEIARSTLLAVLRWLYTGASPLIAHRVDGNAQRLGGAAAAGAAEAATDAAAAEAAAAAAAAAGIEAVETAAEQPPDLVELLVAADALGMDGLRALCENELARSVDESQTLELLSLAERWTCDRLRAFCLATLRRRFGALRRAREKGGPRGAQVEAKGSTPKCSDPMGGEAEKRWRAIGEACDAAQIARLGGLHSLSEGARGDLEEHLGLPPSSLQRTEQEICDAEATAAAAPEGALVDGRAFAGLAVELDGLKSRSDLNRLGALILACAPAEEGSSMRWAVRVCRTGEEVRVKPHNLRPFGWKRDALFAWNLSPLPS